MKVVYFLSYMELNHRAFKISKRRVFMNIKYPVTVRSHIVIAHTLWLLNVSRFDDRCEHEQFVWSVAEIANWSWNFFKNSCNYFVLWGNVDAGDQNKSNHTYICEHTNLTHIHLNIYKHKCTYTHSHTHTHDDYSRVTEDSLTFTTKNTVLSDKIIL